MNNGKQISENNSMFKKLSAKLRNINLTRKKKTHRPIKIKNKRNIEVGNRTQATRTKTL